jgi:hypothetical protein
LFEKKAPGEVAKIAKTATVFPSALGKTMGFSRRRGGLIIERVQNG